VAPENVTPENLVFYVRDHARRIELIERHTDDLGVMRRDIEGITKQCSSLAEELGALRKVIVTAAVGIASSSLFAAATIFLVLK
jgi:hypothetical protein